MTATWISPWSGEQLTADELIREVALDALSHIYILTLLGRSNPDISVLPDSVSVKSNAIDYDYLIPFPAVLTDRMECTLSECLQSLRKEYRFPDCAQDPDRPCGEKVGALLKYFRGMERLIRLVSAVKCWDSRKVLAAHGIPKDHSPLTLKTSLKLAGFHYLVMYPESNEIGSGHFKAIDISTAISLVNSLWPRNPGVVEKFFALEKDYGRHMWISDDNRWIADEVTEVDEGLEMS